MNILSAEVHVPGAPGGDVFPDGESTLCELSGHMVTISRAEDPFVRKALESNTTSFGNLKVSFSSSSGAGRQANSAYSPFLPREERLLRKVVRVLMDPHSSLQDYADLVSPNSNQTSGEEGSFEYIFRNYFLKYAIEGLLFSYRIFSPNSLAPAEQIITSYAETSRYGKTPIKAFAWHEYLNLFAVAKCDNSIHLFDMDTGSWQGHPLKHEKQVDVCAMAWQPLSGTCLALGTQTGALIWHVHSSQQRATAGDGTSFGGFRETKSINGAPRGVPKANIFSIGGPTRGRAGTTKTSWAHALLYDNHAPVTTLSWCPDGRYLATGSPRDASLIIWDTGLEVPTALKRLGSGYGLLKWSPDSKYLFAATVGACFRIWETEQWTHEQWDNVSGNRCKTACWSFDSKSLIFSEEGSSIIYRLGFEDTFIFKGRQSLENVEVKLVADLSDITVSQNGTDTVVGGAIQNMQWDPTGERLVVAFENEVKVNEDEGPSYSQLLATFFTIRKPYFALRLLGYIRGPGLCGNASILRFKPFYQQGALLCVCWESGSLSFYPLITASSNDNSPYNASRMVLSW
eukprot:Nk52_evm21s352 gene=Nk52_evmTU21s352